MDIKLTKTKYYNRHITRYAWRYKRTKGQTVTYMCGAGTAYPSVAPGLQRPTCVEQELLTLPLHLSSPPAFCGVLVTQSLFFCVVFCRSSLVLFLLTIGLSALLQCTDSWLPILVSSNFSWFNACFLLLYNIILCNIQLYTTIYEGHYSWNVKYFVHFEEGVGIL